MNRKIKVLIIDDSVVIRKIISDMLSLDTSLEVCATAANGKIGLEKIKTHDPDVVIVDFEMPEMNGLEFIRSLRRVNKNLPIIMFSTFSGEGAQVTLDAMSAGANDFVLKPSSAGNFEKTSTNVSQELIPKIKSLCAMQKIDPEAVTPFKKTVQGSRIERFDALVIGSSTGGPDALAILLAAIPADLGMPVFIVQHMPPFFTKLLAARLSTKSNLPVVEASEGMAAVDGKIYLAPGDFHMVLKRIGGRIIISLGSGERENSCRPSIDVLFRSASEIYGNGVFAVVLTGMGFDGLKGCRAVKNSGGYVYVQDMETSVVPSMPCSVSNAGLSDGVYSVSSIGDALVKKIRECNSRSDMFKRGNFLK